MANIDRIVEKLKDITLKFEDELRSIRTGKAHASMVEDVLVESYSGKTPLSHIASLSTPDARSILIKPWDKSLLPAIESALKKANLGIQPISDKDQVRLSLPPLTEERRRELTKIIGKKLEDARITVRQARDDFRKDTQKEEQNGKISENQKFSDFKRLDSLVEETNKKIAELAEKKEKEIMTV
ncbi:MAG: ribosome recycling factor [Patescibacteria group bacterium]